MKKVIQYILLGIISVGACGCFPFYTMKTARKNQAPIMKRYEDSKPSEKDNNSKVYTSGITNIDEALHYELGLYFYDGEVVDVGINPEVRAITANTTTLKASELPEELLAETIYAYFTVYKNDLRLNNGYSEEEVKTALNDLYGENYVYTHKLTKTGSCASLKYSSETGNYEMYGGCGGMTPDYDPRIRIKILDKTDTTVTIGRLYYEPSKGNDDWSATGPYKIYNNENKDKLIDTIDNEDINLFDTYKDKIDKYLITFDKDNGYYHFNNLKKIN